MIFHSRYSVPDDINITIRNETLGRVYSTKVLGVLINSKMNWECHVHHINNKLSKCIGIMVKARKKSSLIIIINSLLYIRLSLSVILYSCLGKSGKTVLKLLIKIQNKLVRIITSSGYRTNGESLYQNIKVLKVPEIYDYAIGVFMYKLYHGLMPPIFQCMFAVNSATHDYGTRQKDHYKVPKVKLEVVKNSVRYRGVIIWNMILQNIDIAKSLQSFKFHLRQGILSTLITSVSPNEMWHSSCKQISLLAKSNPSLAPLLTTWPCFLFIAQIDVIICTYIQLYVMLTSVCKLIFVILITTGIYKPFAVSVPSFESWGISV